MEAFYQTEGNSEIGRKCLIVLVLTLETQLATPLIDNCISPCRKTRSIVILLYSVHRMSHVTNYCNIVVLLTSRYVHV